MGTLLGLFFLLLFAITITTLCRRNQRSSEDRVWGDKVELSWQMRLFSLIALYWPVSLHRFENEKYGSFAQHYPALIEGLNIFINIYWLILIGVILIFREKYMQWEQSHRWTFSGILGFVLVLHIVFYW